MPFLLIAPVDSADGHPVARRLGYPVCPRSHGFTNHGWAADSGDLGCRRSRSCLRSPISISSILGSARFGTAAKVSFARRLPCWRPRVNEAGVREEAPLIDKVAHESQAGVIDMYGALQDHPETLPDRVHPNTAGAALMAKAAYQALTGKKFSGSVQEAAPKAKAA